MRYPNNNDVYRCLNEGYVFAIIETMPKYLYTCDPILVSSLCLLPKSLCEDLIVEAYAAARYS